MSKYSVTSKKHINDMTFHLLCVGSSVFEFKNEKYTNEMLNKELIEQIQ